ncbi:MAG: GNAT family N-acetyltransferase [Bacteroidota bacterium]
MHYTPITTHRLNTRFLTPEDAAIWLEYATDAKATKYTLDNLLPGRTPEEAAKEFVHFAINRYTSNRLGLQALIDKQTGDFVGQCGLLVQEVNGQREIEVGYHLLRRHWGKGYAAEAAKAFRDYGFENNFAESMVSIIHPENEASKKVAVRNGMQLAATDAKFRDTDYHLYRITRKEWEQLKSI